MCFSSFPPPPARVKRRSRRRDWQRCNGADRFPSSHSGTRGGSPPWWGVSHQPGSQEHSVASRSEGRWLQRWTTAPSTSCPPPLPCHPPPPPPSLPWSHLEDGLFVFRAASCQGARGGRCSPGFSPPSQTRDRG